MRITAVLFDLDGTLHEDSTAVGLLIDAATEHGFRLDPSAILQGELFKPRLRAELSISETEADAIYATYVRIYHERAATNVRPRDGAVELVSQLRNSGVRLALVTQKVESLARAVLDGLSLSEHFHAVLGHDSTAFRKPDPQVAKVALQLLASAPSAAAMVGDTPADMECGAAAGLSLVVGVLGSVSPEALWDSGATHVCSDLDAVGRLLAARSGNE